MKYRNIRYAQLQGKRRQACPNLQSVNVGSMPVSRNVCIGHSDASGSSSLA